ncbi:hypothetical protein [Tissierella praeacuta]|uniref:hypothetical protein n=1 Tax=Tissierella praeacuta TaxID=43131 RepID=UPI0033422A1D
MEVIQPILIDKTLDYIDNLIFKAKIKINGEYKDFEVFKTIKKENAIRKYLYVEDEIGVIEEAQLFTNQGEVLAIKPYSIEKQLDGLVLTFEFKITVEETNLGYIE